MKEFDWFHCATCCNSVPVDNGTLEGFELPECYCADCYYNPKSDSDKSNYKNMKEYYEGLIEDMQKSVEGAGAMYKDLQEARKQIERMKWHDLRKNPDDLPKRDERFSTNISVAVFTQNNEFAFYSFDDKKWYFQGNVMNVIAWCEVPQYTEEIR